MRRPVAFDFDAEPVHVSVAANTSRPSLFYVDEFTQQQNLIIDLDESGDEDDGDEDDAGGDGACTARTDDEAARRELDAKERQIKLMMDRIAQMEANKRRKTSQASTSAALPAIAPVVAAAVAVPAVTPAPGALEEAKASLGQLVEERKEMIASAAANASAELEAAADGPSMILPGDDDGEPVVMQSPGADDGEAIKPDDDGEAIKLDADDEDEADPPDDDRTDVAMQLSATTRRSPDVRPAS